LFLIKASQIQRGITLKSLRVHPIVNLLRDAKIFKLNEELDKLLRMEDYFHM
jgi:hypothetical protein